MAVPFVSSRRPKESHSRGQQLCKFIGAKDSAYLRKRFHFHRIGLGHQHDGCDWNSENVVFLGWGGGGKGA